MSRWLHIGAGGCVPAEFPRPLADGGTIDDNIGEDYTDDLGTAPFYALEFNISTDNGTAVVWWFQGVWYGESTGLITLALFGDNPEFANIGGALQTSADGAFGIQALGNSESPVDYLTASFVGHKYCSEPTPPYPVIPPLGP